MALSPYLFDASGLADPRIVVQETTSPLNGLPAARMGTKPVVGAHYLFSDTDKMEFLEQEPNAAKFFRPFIGAAEFLRGQSRWILHLVDADPTELRKLPLVRERMVAVREMRAASKKQATRILADFPTKYEVEVIPTAPFLVVPEVSSERRDYIPIAWLEPPVIPSNLVRIIENASKPLFALLTSAMHVSWLRSIGGRLESRYRYSIGLVYNTFPLPLVSPERLQRLAPHTDAVLTARANHPNATLADLYDPDLMPADLRKAHQILDRAVDSLYRRARFASERERVEHLFALYEHLQAPLTAEAAGKRQGSGRGGGG